MDKSLWTLVHFWGVFQFIQAQPLPSPHKQRWTRVSRIFSEFQLCTAWRKGELQENFERVHCFMREIKLCNEKLSLAIACVSGRERSPERAYSRKRVAWDGPGSTVGKKSKKRGPPWVLPWVRHPFSSPDYLSARFARRFFFSPTPIFSPFSHNAKPGPRLVSEQLLLWPLFLISEVVAYESFDCAINTYPICDLLLEFGAAQLRLVREIAPKSLFRCEQKPILSARKTGNMNVPLVLQHCCKTSWIAMLRVLLASFKPVLQQIRLLQVAKSCCRR